MPLLPLFYRLTSTDKFVNETGYGNMVKRQKKGPKKFFLPLTTLILTFFKKLLVSTCFYTSMYVLINGLINVFFEILKFAKNRVKQIRDLKRYVQNFDNDKNLVLVTHYVVISEVLDYAPSSGEIVISDKNFNKIGSIKISY